MTERYGIKELSDALVFGLGNAKLLTETLADGFQTSDIFALLPAIGSANQAIDGIALVPSELSDLSDEEVTAVVDLVKSYLGDMENERAKAIAFKSIQLALVAVQLVNTIKA